MGSILLVLLFAHGGRPQPAASNDAERVTKILVIVGPSDHPPGTHEVLAGGRLIRYCLENSNLQRVEAEVLTAWPQDAELKRRADGVVFIGDQFPPHQMPESEGIMRDLSQMMDRGAGIACIHFATGLRNPDVGPDGDHPLLHWIGGYFASRCEHHKSIARIFRDAEIKPAAAAHAVSRGWKPFTLTDEPYIDNYFGPPDQERPAGLVELATSMLPPEAPRPQVVAWGLQRPDGGRGFGIVMPHFYHNWQLDDLRTLILNGIAWSAGCEIPPDGVRIELSDLDQFQPAAGPRSGSVPRD